MTEGAVRVAHLSAARRAPGVAVTGGRRAVAPGPWGAPPSADQDHMLEERHVP